jgi:hypothetical protein
VTTIEYESEIFETWKKQLMKTIGLITFLLLSLAARGQHQVVATAGDFDQNESGSVSWTLGQVVTPTLSGTDMVLTQGFQQVSLEVVASNAPGLDAQAKVKAYPNPVANRITVEVGDLSNSTLSFELYTLQGQLVKKKSIHTDHQRINMEGKPSGEYLLRILSDGKPVESFKIIKR